MCRRATVVRTFGASRLARGPPPPPPATSTSSDGTRRRGRVNRVNREARGAWATTTTGIRAQAWIASHRIASHRIASHRIDRSYDVVDARDVTARVRGGGALA